MNEPNQLQAELEQIKQELEKARADLARIVSSVRDMRRAQKYYFADRSRFWLQKSKALEKEVDLLIDPERSEQETPEDDKQPRLL